MRHFIPQIGLVLALVMTGCGKKPADGGGTSGDSVGGPAAVGPSVTDWSNVGGVKVRVVKAAVQKPMMVVVGGTDAKEGKEPELLMWVEIGNLTPDKKLSFTPWGGGQDKDGRPEAELTDDKGNVYNLIRDEIGQDVKGNDSSGSGVINPGETPLVWAFRFERPVSAATVLRLSARPPVENPPAGRHELRIPAAAWKR